MVDIGQMKLKLTKGAYVLNRFWLTIKKLPLPTIKTVVQ